MLNEDKQESFRFFTAVSSIILLIVFVGILDDDNISIQQIIVNIIFGAILVCLPYVRHMEDYKNALYDIMFPHRKFCLSNQDYYIRKDTFQKRENEMNARFNNLFETYNRGIIEHNIAKNKLNIANYKVETLEKESKKKDNRINELEKELVQTKKELEETITTFNKKNRTNIANDENPTTRDAKRLTIFHIMYNVADKFLNNNSKQLKRKQNEEIEEIFKSQLLTIEEPYKTHALTELKISEEELKIGYQLPKWVLDRINKFISEISKK